MTIYEIKRDYLAHNPEGHFFDRSTLRFFGQTLRDFSVKKLDAGIYRVTAPMRPRGQYMGRTDWKYSTFEHKFFH